MDTGWAIVNTAAALVMGFAAAYFFICVGSGLVQLRRAGVRLGAQSKVSYGRPYDPKHGDPRGSGFEIYYLIPCLNEEAVIGATVSSLASAELDFRIFVIDDASDDDTGAIASAAGGAQVTVVRRELPMARLGKGAALNEGYAHVRADVAARGLDPSKVLVCVMDADGRLSDGAVGAVTALFEDDTVGGAQLSVRIRNRSTNFLLRFQDYQFWTQSSLTQLGRMKTSSVSLGGNGQFARLSALMELGDAPWTEALTEDLDLAISLAVRGWNLTTTPLASVDQQGIESLRPLIRQRTRWYQGHMMAMKRAPEVLGSPNVSHGASIEMLLYLAVPWLFDLPWSILYHLILIQIAITFAGVTATADPVIAWGSMAVVIYVLGFWPALITAVLAYRRDPEMGRLRTLAIGHSFLITNYISYICAWRALFRIILRRNGWVKTSRVTEVPAAPATAS
ncbi:glycosyltransferase family 2 protein [Nocardioides sp. AE5]|uniref:glycosyltransferase family 2 protein n=1 Tax=Nocardioides sp. AE5 TaxID=2962573 RepID=UPI0028811A4B|nr:glycosyltransferase family 2 protein [Nocardioides sp. AE5]MDT0203427.1 glycosyltransferase family 2 protein [Nocardioides sp. AE5]